MHRGVINMLCKHIIFIIITMPTKIANIHINELSKISIITTRCVPIHTRPTHCHSINTIIILYSLNWICLNNCYCLSIKISLSFINFNIFTKFCYIYFSFKCRLKSLALTLLPVCISILKMVNYLLRGLSRHKRQIN